MSDTPVDSQLTSSAAERRRVLAATTIGTAIEWYDYFLYAAVAGLVFNHNMFGSIDGGVATVISFLTVGLSFLFRPIGAVIAGKMSDRFGRRVVLMATLFAMGFATTFIGLLPTYDTIGVWAPLILILLRIVQGVSAGGEWGSAVLLAVEHAPASRRGLYGAGPQIGVPIGLLLSSSILFLMNHLAPDDAFVSWGWRVPFLLSIVLVGVGYAVRVGVDESPVFSEIAERREYQADHPVRTLFRRFWPLVVVGALIFAGNNTVGYMTTGGYIQNYATNPDGPAFERGDVLAAVTVSAVSWLVFTLLAGWVSDRIGRRTTYIVGFIIQAIAAATLFPLVNTGGLGGLYAALVFLTVGLGLTYGQQSAMYAELFPASIRATGASITYAIGSILGGAFAPTIASALVRATGTTVAVSVYLVAACCVGLGAAFVLRERRGIPLGREYEELQEKGHFRFSVN